MKIQNGDLISLPQKYNYTFTIFTPTYNRRHTLHRVYESLKTQTYDDFEWLLIDDGSTDDTFQLVSHWQRENNFPIRYIYQENSGKHVAFNRGVKEAKGYLFLTLDSDDACIPEALARFKYHWDSIPEDEQQKFSAVTCLCRDEYGKIVGERFPFDITDSDSLEIYYKYKVRGEKWGFHTTEVLKQFPFPEEVKQTYIPESLVWNRIARKYKTRFVNEPLRIYWTEGLSLSTGGNPKRSSFGRRMVHLNALNEETDWLKFSPELFFRSAINYSRNSIHLGVSLIKQFQDIENQLSRALWVMCLPFGYFVYVLDSIGLRKG